MDKQYYVYIITNKRNGTLYTGITSNLIQRIYQHKNKTYEGFTSKHDIGILLHYEIYNDPESAIKREKNIKSWKRDWKLRLIEKGNPDWNDLYDNISTG
jgi:putative endonuclease